MKVFSIEIKKQKQTGYEVFPTERFVQFYAFCFVCLSANDGTALIDAIEWLDSSREIQYDLPRNSKGRFGMVQPPTIGDLVLVGGTVSEFRSSVYIKISQMYPIHDKDFFSLSIIERLANNHQDNFL
ncbi:hypothetical protein AYI68_g6123 [Smittium mucronatum]|uniref:Uncharacterized protein n=1 Tax=Smittium mucronatum TaxID=133383 RepID=A0A1R0GSG3_9FUNG|nr:hypothetical protein AYI68_g6123 [Smittium mucronatum]